VGKLECVVDERVSALAGVVSVVVDAIEFRPRVGNRAEPAGVAAHHSEVPLRESARDAADDARGRTADLTCPAPLSV
jgi:hypothetical protein